jgi:3-phytase
MKKIVWAVLFLLLLLPNTLFAQETVLVEPTGETAPSPADGATAVAVWVHPTDPSQSLLITTDDNFGLATYDLDGAEVQQLETGTMGSVDVRYSFPYNGETVSLIAAGVKDAEEILLFTVDPETGLLEQIGSVATVAPHVGLCLYFSLITGNHYVFNTAEDGSVEQYVIGDDGAGGITATLARAFNVGSETEGCVADDRNGHLFLGEVAVALWRYDAEPEPSFPRRVIDAVGLGNITEEIKGLALYTAADGEGYLLAADETSNGFLVYERGGDQAFVGTFAVGASDDVDEVSEPNALDVVNLGLSDVYTTGLLITADDSNTTAEDEGEGNNFKLVPWEAVAEALDLAIDTSEDERSAEVATYRTRNGAVSVSASGETIPVEAATDAADDPAIWIHPTDTALSTIIGTDKSDEGGLGVYNLDGSLHQFVTIGAVNNVDVRYNFPLAGEPTTIVAATNRTNNTIVVYRVNPETRELEDVAAREIVSNVPEVYGFCLYHSAITGNYYAFLNSTDIGAVEQWELFDDGSGLVDAELVREFVVPMDTQTEGCVADDELGFFYIGEEDVGIWKYGAEPDDDAEPTAVDFTEEGDEPGNLVADVEGLSLYYGADGTGYLLASSQGSSEFTVYTREGDNDYIGKFVVSENALIDGVTGSDGLDVTNFPLGDGFPFGLFVTQDDTNLNPSGNQNFKLVPWESIAESLGLTSNTEFDPRSVGADE